MDRVRVGCSGWVYNHWRGDFYPAGISTTGWFEHYARTFDTVEINNSFYRLPSSQTFERWRRQAPPSFLYAVKASRYLTHLRKLKEPGEPLALFFERARHLGSTLGPVLYQLPPGWNRDVQRLTAFVEALPAGVRHVIEFRDPSWYHDEVFAVLERRRVALCLHDMTNSTPPRLRVGPFAYVRFHGASAKYGGGYADDQLREWANWLGGERDAGREVFAYFNNDIGGHAPRDAVRLRAMLS